MSKYVLAVMLVVVGATAVDAKEPLKLSRYGLSSLRKMSDREGNSVRGAGVTASGLSSLSAIFYDPTTGSKANVDLQNFSLAHDPAACSTAVAQNYNQIGVSGPLLITFPSGLTASISSFSAGGASQGLLNPIGVPFLVQNPTTIP